MTCSHPGSKSGNRGFRFATTPDLTGDFNHDGTVDAGDYAVWREGLGTTYTQTDYGVWRAHYGQTAGSGSAISSAESQSTGVPEPSGFTVVASLLCLLFTIPRFRRVNG
jgi:hypothetical protein